MQQQIIYQKTNHWDIDQDIPWQTAIDINKHFLPLDRDNIAFPGANTKQQIVLSQYVGLLVNTTIAEMEDVAYRIRNTAWQAILSAYPINPEMFELGELFFEEEHKHSLAFYRFNDYFCRQLNIDQDDMNYLLPKAYGSRFFQAILENSKRGGHAFWWIVSQVEEQAVYYYHLIHRNRNHIDPLFFKIHRRHFEEESRHTNYAFLMLEVIRQRNHHLNLKNKWHQVSDFAYSQLYTTGWVLAELSKIYNVKHIAHKHPWFETLASCLELLKGVTPFDLFKKLFISAPYISAVLNPRYHKHSMKTLKVHKGLSIKLPNPKPSQVNIPLSLAQSEEDNLWQAS